MAVVDETAQQVTQLAARADTSDIDGWFARIVRDLLALLAAAWRTVLELTGFYVEDHAAAEGHTVEPRLAEWNTEQVVTSLRVQGPVAFKEAIRAGHDETQALKSMTSQLSGAAEKIVLRGDRDTVQATVEDSDEIVGWRRVSDGDPCSWCAMLISRGAAYKSGRTAGDIRFGGAAYHDHDHCTAEPLYEHEEEPPEVADLYQQWLEVTAGKSGDDAIRTWRAYWDNRNQTAQAEPDPELVEPARAEPRAEVPAAPAPRPRQEAAQAETYTGPRATPPEGFTPERVAEFKRLMIRWQKEPDLSWATKEEEDFLFKPRDQHPAFFKRIEQEIALDEKFDDFYQRHGGGMSEAEFKAEMESRLRKAFTDGPIGIRVNDDILRQMFTDGRYKTQFEVGYSMGGYDPEYRRNLEEQLFGTPRNEDMSKRPIYGFVGSGGKLAAGLLEDDALSNYGNVSVILKDKLRRRSTAMVGDSIDEKFWGQPSPLLDPDWRSYGMGDKYAAPNLRKFDRDYSSAAWRRDFYLEVQIHGGVSVFDVERIVFPDDPPEDLRDILADFEIPWEVQKPRSRKASK